MAILAPHMGGAWERPVRTMKTTLTFRFNDETLRSALCEVEIMINSRPLTFIALDSAEDDALAPNYLLLGSVDGYKPLCEINYCSTKHSSLLTIFGDDGFRSMAQI